VLGCVFMLCTVWVEPVCTGCALMVLRHSVVLNRDDLMTT